MIERKLSFILEKNVHIFTKLNHKNSNINIKLEIILYIYIYIYI